MSVVIKRHDLPTYWDYETYADLCVEEGNIILVQDADGRDVPACRVYLAKESLLALIELAKQTWPEWFQEPSQQRSMPAKRYVLVSREHDGSGCPVVHKKMLTESERDYWLPILQSSSYLKWEAHEVE